jgi:hypothetical protein
MLGNKGKTRLPPLCPLRRLRTGGDCKCSPVSAVTGLVRECGVKALSVPVREFQGRGIRADYRRREPGRARITRNEARSGQTPLGQPSGAPAQSAGFDATHAIQSVERGAAMRVGQGGIVERGAGEVTDVKAAAPLCFHPLTTQSSKNNGCCLRNAWELSEYLRIREGVLRRRSARIGRRAAPGCIKTPVAAA